MAILLLILQLIGTWFLVGLIWTIQVVHYPLFAGVGADRFIDYQHAHARLITLVVGPLMLIEAATALLFLTIRPAGIPAWVAWTGAALLLVIWVSTALIQVPDHGRLAGGFDVDVHHRLVTTNWIRTICWTARGCLLAWATWSLLTAVRGG
ncbi:MAG: hypothetical protein CMJ34_00120 [Phycisphaerae bacterium]|nr:hypothetical protein [Phycisphaerae bacterium]